MTLMLVSCAPAPQPTVDIGAGAKIRGPITVRDGTGKVVFDLDQGSAVAIDSGGVP
jgi:hypothetical protein